MPRLLLVDDNPSIHRIAESLLAPTDVELVCAGSAAEALDRLGRGERFDVALVDTAMAGMDGWTLVSRLRELEATAAMPIALMAGVLDPVDPARLASAPVQGFLKKPIELRELGDRVKTLIATPVQAAPAPSPFSTVPSTPVRELLQRAEASLPEFRSEPEAQPVDDLLLLTAEDMWPEETQVLPVSAELPEMPEPEMPEPEVQLELEELDLDSLALNENPLVLEESGTEAPVAAPVPAPVEDALGALPDLEDLDLGTMPEDLPLLAGSEDVLGLAEPIAPDEAVTASGPEVTFHVAEALASIGQLPPLSDTLVLEPLEPVAAEPEAAPEFAPEAAPEAMEIHEAPRLEVSLPALEPLPAMAAEGQAPAATGQDAAPAQGGQDQARAAVQALLADPVLVDALVRAVVARMGDQILREVAWEVMPELAEKLRS